MRINERKIKQRGRKERKSEIDEKKESKVRKMRRKEKKLRFMRIKERKSEPEDKEIKERERILEKREGKGENLNR